MPTAKGRAKHWEYNNERQTLFPQEKSQFRDWALGIRTRRRISSHNVNSILIVHTGKICHLNLRRYGLSL